MNKIKSFTLIEILVSSLIFVVVVTTGVSAFALVRSSNEKTDDVRLADQCSRQVREKLSEIERTAQISPRVNAIQFNTDKTGFSLVAVTSTGGLSEGESTSSQYEGVALFDTPSTKFKAFYKKDGLYYLGSYTRAATYSFASNDSPIMSEDCMAFSTAPEGSIDLSSYNFEQPFKVYFEKHYPDYDQSKQEDVIYKIILNDLAYRSNKGGTRVEDEGSSIERSSTSKIFVELTNSARKLW